MAGYEQEILNATKNQLATDGLSDADRAYIQNMQELEGGKDKPYSAAQYLKDTFETYKAGGLAAQNAFLVGKSDEISGYAQTGMEAVGTGASKVLPEALSQYLPQLNPNLNLGENLAENKQEADVYEKRMAREHPVADVLGNIAGSTALMAGTGGALGAAKVGTTAGAVVNAVTGRAVTRIPLAMALGGTEAGLTAYNDQLDVKSAVAGGALGAGLGQTLGEVIPHAFGYMTGKLTKGNKDDVLRRVYQDVAAAYGDDVDVDAVRRLIASAEELGPKASLVDLEEVLAKRGINLVGSKAGVANAKPLVKHLAQRAKDAPSEFEASMTQILGNPRGATAFKADKAADFSRWSKEYATALDNSSVTKDADEVMGDITKYFTREGANGKRSPISSTTTTASNSLRKFVADVTNSKAAKDVYGADGALLKGVLPEDIPQLTATDLRSIQGEIDTLFDANLKITGDAADKAANSSLAQMRSVMKGVLGKDEAISALNKNYSSGYSSLTAFDQGSALITKKGLTVEDAKHYVDLYGNDTDAINSLAEGAKDALVRKLDNATPAQLPKLLSRTTNERLKMESVFGKDLTERIYESARANAFGKSDKKFGAAVASGIVAPPPSLLAQAGDVALASAGILTDKASSAAGYGAGRRVLGGVAGNPARQDQYLATLLSKQGPELQSLFSDMLKQSQDMSVPVGATSLLGAGLGGAAQGG